MRRWLLAAAVVAGCGLAVVLAVGADPLRALAAALDGALGSWVAMQETLAKATPLLWCGLAVAVAFRSGVWNIGAEGQLLAGATASVWVALVVPAGPWSAVVALVVGGIAGAAWAGVAALLRAASGVNEVLSTILLNLVAQSLVGWAVHGPLREPGGTYPQTALVPPEAWLWRPFAPGRAHLGLLLALVAAGVLAVVLRRTAWGLEVRAVGEAPTVARTCGIPAGSLQAQALVLSGFLAGVGGAVEVLAITHRLFQNLSPGWGYSGIAVALLGGLAPGGTVAASLMFGALDAGAGGMQRAAGVPAVTVVLLQGLVVVALAVRRRS